MMTCVNSAEYDEANYASVTRHSAVPDTQDSKRIFRDHRGTIKQHVPDPASDEDAKQRSEKNKVPDLIFLERAVTVSGQQFHHVKRGNESGNVREAIPSDSDLVVELNKERTEMMNVKGEEHGKTRLGQFG
jgi:hypothetical protein